MNTDAQLADQAVAWIESARRQMRPRGSPLPPERLNRWGAYFPRHVLDAARVVHVDDMGDVPQLPASILAEPGMPAPIELDKIAGLTLVDTICLSRARLRNHSDEELSLFQELVHVTQFARLGTPEFLRRYLDGWLSAGRDNARIPLELQAEELRHRYARHPDIPFRVDSALAHEEAWAQSSYDSTFRPSTPHAVRPIRPFEPVQFSKWALKRYAITADGGPCAEAVMEAATRLARDTLESIDPTGIAHGFAYCIAHVGRDGTYVIVDWWSGENMLSQRLFARPPDSHGVFEPFARHDIVTCIWEVQVHAHEARAWIDFVLRQPQSPDFSGYMRHTLSTTI